MEAEKFNSLPSASQRNTKADGIIQFHLCGLRTGGTDVRGQEKMDVPAHQAEQILPSSTFSF